MRSSYEIIETAEDRFVSLPALERMGYTRDDFRRYCDEVAGFTGEDYFTLHSLRNSGFEPSISFEKYGDTFYESLLREDPRFRYQWTAGLSIFRQTQETVSRRTLIVDMIRSEGIMQIDDLLALMKEYYGVDAERWDVTEAIRNTDIRYDLADGILSVG